MKVVFLQCFLLMNANVSLQTLQHLQAHLYASWGQSTHQVYKVTSIYQVEGGRVVYIHHFLYIQVFLKKIKSYFMQIVE